MNFGTALVLAIVIAIVALALWAIFKKKSTCSCGGNCEGCGASKSCPATDQAARLVENFGASN